MMKNGPSTGDLDVFSNLRGWAPEELVNFLTQIVVVLPDELRARLKHVIDSIPREGDNLQKVLEVVRRQWTGLRSEEWVEIAIVGPARTGKTSLVNAILQRKDPGFESVFTVVDIQGLEEYLGYDRRRPMEQELSGFDVIVLVLDARFSLSEETRRMYDKLRKLDKPLLVVLNKIDMVEHAATALKAARRQLGTGIYPASIYQPEMTNKLFKGIVARHPNALYPLTRGFPEFRAAICRGITTQTAFAAGVVGAIPIPVSDLLPLTAIQTAMILKIARAFGFKINRERARELVPMLLAGMMLREGGHRLRERFPRQARLIGISMAGIWTYLLGQAAIQYFDRFSNFLVRSESGREEPLLAGETGG